VREETIKKKTRQGWPRWEPSLALVVVLLLASGTSAGETVQFTTDGLVLLGFWLLPVIIAVKRRHPQLVPILLITVLASWTVIGWFVAPSAP
jgi:hypothetical protein